MSKFKKTKKNYKLYKKPIKIQSIDFGGIYPLETAMYYEFGELHRSSLPFRKPIVNKLRATIIERNVGKTEYDELYYAHELDEKRIRDSLSSKYCEPKVIEKLCEYFGISQNTNFYDFIANYDFEKKEIGHKKGMRTTEDRNNFLIEYRKSWSEETVQAYIDELMNDEDQFYYDDNVLCKIEDEKKQMYFKKLYRIYEEYPGLIMRFCDMFVEEE